MEIALPIIYAIVFIFLIYKIHFFEIPTISRTALTAVFILKIIAGTILWWLYSYHYPGADLLDYFNDGKTLFNLSFNNPGLLFQVIFEGVSYPGLHSWNDSFEHILYNDSHTMIVLNMILHFFSFGFFHVHTVFLCFISLIGLTALYKTFMTRFTDGKKILFVVIFLIPSVLFWSSGVLKEGLLFFGMGILLYVTNCGLETRYNLLKKFFVLLAIAILLLIKFYVLIALLPGLLLNRWVSATSAKWLITKYITIIFVCICGVVALSAINQDYNPLQIISQKQAKAISESQGGVFLQNDRHFICVDYDKRNEVLQPIKDSVYRIIKGSSYLQWGLENMQDTTFIKNAIDTTQYSMLYEIVPAKTTLQLNRLQPTFTSILSNTPAALLTVLVQPLIWKVKGVVQLLPALENIFFIGLFIITVLFFNKKMENKKMIIFCLSFVLILFTLIGITTPAVGAVIRYKVPALPFLGIALLLLMDRKKIAEKFPAIAKWME